MASNSSLKNATWSPVAQTTSCLLSSSNHGACAFLKNLGEIWMVGVVNLVVSASVSRRRSGWNSEGDAW